MQQLVLEALLFHDGQGTWAKALQNALLLDELFVLILGLLEPQPLELAVLGQVRQQKLLHVLDYTRVSNSLMAS